VVTLTRDRHEWAFTCGRVSALEGRLVTHDFFLGLVATERSDDLLHRLQDTQLRDYVGPGSSWEDWTTVIDTYFHDQVVSLRETCPNKALPNLFLLSEDYLNVKRAILGLGTYPFCSGLFGPDTLTSVAAGNYAAMPMELRGALAELGGQTAVDDQARLVLDVVLDGAYLRHLFAIAKELNVPVLSAWISDMTLARAVVALCRAVRSGIPARVYQQHFLPVDPHTHTLTELMGAGAPETWGALLPGDIGALWQTASQEGEDEQITRFGVLAYNHLTKSIRRAKLQTSGPERVFGYLWGLLVEAYNLKLIISGRLNGIVPDLLRRRLRECYV